MSTVVFWLGVGGCALLAVSWLAYPATIYVLSWFGRYPPSDRAWETTVTVVVVTRDDPVLVRRRVRHLLRTHYPPEKLDVVVSLDAGSPHEPTELGGLAGHPAVRVMKGSGARGKAPALNAGVDAARGEVVVFADTHQRFAPDTIPNLVSAFADPRVGAASGKLVLRRRERGISAADLYWAFEAWLRGRESRLHSPVGVTGAVSAVRRSLWTPLPERLILDDVYTPMRLVLEGYRVAFVDSAVAYETRRPSPGAEYRRKTRTLTGVIQLCAWLPAVLAPHRNPIFLQFVLHKLSRMLTPFAGVLVALWGGLSLATHRPEWLGPLTVVFGVALLWAGFGKSDNARSLRRMLQEVVLTQAAVVGAIVNGVRGKWDVWG